MFELPCMPTERDIVYQIELEPSSIPPYKWQYRISAAELAEVIWQLNEYLEKEWTCPSCSPYGTPIIFIWKKTGELHMTVNYRAPNRQTKKDIYLLPRIDDLLDKLSKVRFLSAIDLASGYHYIKLADNACEKTAFVTRYGLFEYTVLLLGLCNTPSTFQHLMNAVMSGYIEELRVKLKRCEFGKPYVKYFGHVVGSGELRVDSDKVAAVLDWEPPKDIKAV